MGRTTRRDRGRDQRRRVAWALLAAGALALGACAADDTTSTERPAPETPSPTTPAATTTNAATTASTSPAEAPVDPLPRLLDPTDPLFAQTAGEPVLHESGTGPAIFEVPVVDPSTPLRVIVSCVPEGAEYSFRVGPADQFYAAACTPLTGITGQFALLNDAPLEAELTLPDDAAWWVVAIPVAAPATG